MKHWVCLWSDWAGGVTEVLLCIIGSSMALLIGVQVFSRYVLNHSLFWSEEIGRICLVWITFLGGSAAYRRHAHIGIDFFVNRLPSRLRRASEILVLVASLVFFAVLVGYGSIFVWFVSAQKTAALGISTAVPYLVIPVGGALFFLHGLRDLLELLSSDGA
jgi:TRAP-type C4-dicarboxylate transport system permease small subunit